MKIKKNNYEEYIKSNNKNTLLANSIKEGNCNYYIILDIEDNIYSFYLYKKDNWLALNMHDKESIFDNKDIMQLIFIELKKEYNFVIVRIDSEFKNRIEKWFFFIIFTSYIFL